MTLLVIAAAAVASCIPSDRPYNSEAVTRAWIADLSAGRWAAAGRALSARARILNADGDDGALAADEFLSFSAQERTTLSGFTIVERIGDGTAIEAIRVRERGFGDPVDHLWIITTDRGCITEFRRV